AKLSALADYQNLQRRTEERIQHMEFLANISVVNEIIDIIDDFDRAFSHAKEGVDLAGFQAIKNKLIQILVRMNVEEVIVNKGDEFNAHLHEAVTTLPSNDKKNVHKIAELVQKGYLIRKGENVEVIRPARVVVFS
ncbi:nucleotide exchange factor GrpE, partial [Candidatus Dojkabacteria bacterium]|nr:nucleotide exchange factor GrpE [Candidatus Dojkabacteria bacterium]